mgnify:CR=1 FL=1
MQFASFITHTWHTLITSISLYNHIYISPICWSYLGRKEQLFLSFFLISEYNLYFCDWFGGEIPNHKHLLLFRV